MLIDNICLGCMEDKGLNQVCLKCGYVEGTEPESPLYLKPGTILKGQYLIGEVLGHGGFGITYIACDINLGKKLAVKEYFPQGMATRNGGDSTISVYSGRTKEQFDYGLDKFLDEARTLAMFDDIPEIVIVKDFFKENGTAYIVMSYIEGITLKEYMAQMGGRLPLDTVLTFMLPVIKALEQVHRAGILHRDISPDNIYITRNFSVKLLDFGAARFAIGEHSKSLSVLLKPGYAPEEQYRSKGKQGPWTDVYEVAATMYKALTGETPPEALDRLEEDTLVKPSGMGVEIPEGIEGVLIKALAVRAENRYQTIDEFEKMLDEVLKTDKSLPDKTVPDETYTLVKEEEAADAIEDEKNTENILIQDENLVEGDKGKEEKSLTSNVEKKARHKGKLFAFAAAASAVIVVILACVFFKVLIKTPVIPEPTSLSAASPTAVKTPAQTVLQTPLTTPVSTPVPTPVSTPMPTATPKKTVKTGGNTSKQGRTTKDENIKLPAQTAPEVNEGKLPGSGGPKVDSGSLPDSGVPKVDAGKLPGGNVPKVDFNNFQ